MADLEALLSSLGLAIVTVDRKLRVRRFTEEARLLVNVTPTDIGRPLADLRRNVDVAGFDDLVRESAARAMITVRDVQDRAGLWHTLSIRPYRLAHGDVDGAVIVLGDPHAPRENEEGGLSDRLLRVQDAERRRLARELHDSTAQCLAALIMNLDIVDRKAKGLDPRLRSALAEARELAEQCSKEVRTLTYLRYPPLLDEKGLASALRWYVIGFTARSGIRVELNVSDVGRMPPRVEHALYRIAQESLSNVHRHSGSRTAEVSLSRTSTSVELVVRDRGRGTRPARRRPDRGGFADALGVGIRTMRERVHQLRGTFEIETGRTGTIVRLQIPLTRPVRGAHAHTHLR